MQKSTCTKLKIVWPEGRFACRPPRQPQRSDGVMEKWVFPTSPVRTPGRATLPRSHHWETSAPVLCEPDCPDCASGHPTLLWGRRESGGGARAPKRPPGRVPFARSAVECGTQFRFGLETVAFAQFEDSCHPPAPGKLALIGLRRLMANAKTRTNMVLPVLHVSVTTRRRDRGRSVRVTPSPRAHRVVKRLRGQAGLPGTGRRRGGLRWWIPVSNGMFRCDADG
jgi:hypothetical protein